MNSKLSEMTKVQDKNGNWIFIVPVTGVSIKKSVGGEIKINRVIFVSGNKLSRIRKRLKIPVPISEIINKDKFSKGIIKKFFDDSETFAILRFNGIPSDEIRKCNKIIETELNILSLSQLGFGKRKYNSKLSIGLKDSNRVSSITINKKYNEYTFSSKWDSYSSPFIIEKPWKTFHKKFYYFEYLKILRGEIRVSNLWLKIISRAGFLIGKSQSTNDVSSSFIWNMIALEMLLVGDGEKTEETLIERSKYLLDWSEEWELNQYEFNISECYKKRNEYVHSGNMEIISRGDLIFTDDWAFNILNNLIRLKKIIVSKDDLIKMSKRYSAERVLEIKSRKYQPGYLNMVNRKYVAEDFKEI
ncbi:MAG: HEPN domain-containing protein [Cytophagales bacterium]